MNNETTIETETIEKIEETETIEKIEANFFTLSKELKKLVSGIDFDLTKSIFTPNEQAVLDRIKQLRQDAEQAKLDFRNNLFETCNINASISNKDYTTETFRGKTMYIYSSEICTKLQKSEEELYNVTPAQIQNLLFFETSLFVDVLKQICKLFNINDYSFNIEFLKGKFVISETRHDITKRKQSEAQDKKTFELKRLSVATDVIESSKIGEYIVTCQYFENYNKFVVIDEISGNKELILEHSDQPNELVKKLGVICFGKEVERNGKRFLSEKFPLHFSYIAKS